MSLPGADRRLAAILSADVVGYSRLMAEDEDATVRTLAAYRDEIALLVGQHRGRVVDATGDNLLAEFSTATNAVACAVEIQGILGVRNARLAQDRRMEFRIGIDLGEARVEAERLYGSGVNIAARLQSLAEPGGICVSGAVQDQVGSKLALSYMDLGEQSLKNIPEPVRAYRVRVDEAVALPTSGRHRAWGIAVAPGAVMAAAIFIGWRLLATPEAPVASTAPIRALAVLPLENLSGDPGQEYFADGMTEALIGDLGKIRALRVISRTSVMQYKGARKPLPEIAVELGVDALLEGTVMRVGDRVRITAQLIDGRTDHHLWSERYDRDLRGVLVLQSDIARAVAKQVRLELTPEQRAAASRSVDPRAHDAYLRGLEARRPGRSALQWAPPAIAEFERAVELDPDFAEGWAGLANARQWLAWVDPRQRGEFLKAREAADRAIDLDDSIGEGHAALGWVLLGQEWDFEGARRALERAMEVAPSDPFAVHAYAFYLLLVERTEEALSMMERLQRVAPLDRFYRGFRVRNFYYARRYERALDEAQRIRERDPDFRDENVWLSYFALGRLEEAHQGQLDQYEHCGQPCAWQREAVERGWSEGGWTASIRNLADALRNREDVSPVNVAGAFSIIRDTDEAFAWLERGYRERDPGMTVLRAHPAFDPLRSDHRFQDLLHRIGFPES
jgi:TolB-like protein/class 3 adenylate cyclase/tetratricopeptide (TPR) repeat protein